MSPHISNSTKILQSDNCFSWLVECLIHQTNRKVLGKVCAWVHVSPLHQNHIYTDLCPFLTGTVSWSFLRYCLPDCSPHFAPVQFSSVAQLCLTFCNLMDCSRPGFPVHHQLLELTQTHVHRVGDATQPSHSLSSPSSAFSLSQHQGLFQWVNSLNQVAKVLSPNKT